MKRGGVDTRKAGGDICSFMFVHWVQISMIYCVHFSMSLGELLGPNDWAECKQCGVGEGKPLQQTLTDPDGVDVGTCSPGRPARTRHGSGGPRPVRRAFEKLAQIIRHLDGFIVSRCKKRVHPQGSMTNMNVFRWLETTETTKPKIWV